MSSEAPRFEYLNTDLDLVCTRELTPLTEALNANGLRPLHVTLSENGLWYSILELSADANQSGPEETIGLMLNAIEAVDGEAKALWDACSTRDFNIGYDCGHEPWAFNYGLSNST